MDDQEMEVTSVEQRVLQMREAGAPWQEIAHALDITRQQARYAYQRAKREERRQARRGGTTTGAAE